MLLVLCDLMIDSFASLRFLFFSYFMKRFGIRNPYPAGGEFRKLSTELPAGKR